eukprot:TRINITY_DN16026_c0_g2_i3.p1 TRINITY_DN16026_c0_g2~~TRINITY_DN16026_c0_g2_i3.p1  ORF type:complete len:310 (+),score=31.64 TRINITY_DN16026_c0_g2_i3:63-932(+)
MAGGNRTRPSPALAEPGGSRERSVGVGEGSPSPRSPRGVSQCLSPQVEDVVTFSNRLVSVRRDTRPSRRVVTQGETMIRHHTYYPALKSAIGMVGPQTGSPVDASSPYPSSTREVMTSTNNGGLARALKELSYLYRDGDLSLEEYNKAKQQVIEGEHEKSLAAMLDEMDEGEVETEQLYEVSVAPSVYNPRVPGFGRSPDADPDRKDRQIAALIDENTGLRAVTDRLTHQLHTSRATNHYASPLPDYTPTPQAQAYDIIPTKPAAKPITPPGIPHPTGEWSMQTLRSPV